MKEPTETGGGGSGWVLNPLEIRRETNLWKESVVVLVAETSFL